MIYRNREHWGRDLFSIGAGEIEKSLENAGTTSKEIHISALRVGVVVERHEVLIVGENDKIEISHESFSRKVFALGAVKAVNFINKKSGFYEMSNVLNIKQALSNYFEGTDNILLEN